MHAVDGRNLIKMSFEFENVGLLQLQPTFAICPNYSNSSTFGTLIEKLVPFLVFPDCELMKCSIFIISVHHCTTTTVTIHL